MNMRVFLLFVLFSGLSASGALAQQVCSNCHRLLSAEEPGTSAPGKPRSIPHTHERAGFPHRVSRHAAPSNSNAIVGYQVGGGSAFHAEAPHLEDGTWGWDDTGRAHGFRRVILGWTRGRRHQGGAGAYATDGAHVPDIPGGLAARLRGGHP
jgi:hypothetical protein